MFKKYGNKNLGTNFLKIREQKLQKSRNKNYKNLGTKVTKIRNKNLGIKITQIQEQNVKNLGTKIPKIWEQKLHQGTKITSRNKK
jgi:hypothetical protein